MVLRNYPGRANGMAGASGVAAPAAGADSDVERRTGREGGFQWSGICFDTRFESCLGGMQFAIRGQVC